MKSLIFPKCPKVPKSEHFWGMKSPKWQLWVENGEVEYGGQPGELQEEQQDGDHLPMWCRELEFIKTFKTFYRFDMAKVKFKIETLMNSN